MRIYQDAYIKCTKDAAVTILNRAFHALGPKNRLVIETDESIEAINKKIEKAEDRLRKNKKDFTLLDFLDERNRQDSPYKDYVQAFIDDPDPDYCDDYRVSLSPVEKSEEEYTINIRSCVDECQGFYGPNDWQDWCERMVRLYGCRIIFKDESWDERQRHPWHESYFYHQDGNDIKKTGVELVVDTAPYWALMDRLKEETGMSRSWQLELAISDYEYLVGHLKQRIESLEEELDKENKAEAGIQEEEPDKEISDEELPF